MSETTRFELPAACLVFAGRGPYIPPPYKNFVLEINYVPW